MKSRVLSFETKYNQDTTHRVQVYVHRTRAIMRAQLRKAGNRDTDDANACCGQAHKPGKDNFVAHIHLALDYLTVSTVSHECSHAAWHRTVLRGFAFEAVPRRVNGGAKC